MIRVKEKKKITKKCNFKKSLKKNTFFDNSNLKIREIFDFVIATVVFNPPKTNYLENEFGWSSTTVVDWNSFVREIFIHWSFENSQPKLGGEGKTVENDEAKLGKRKYNGG